jgi:hypothetical protein
MRKKQQQTTTIIKGTVKPQGKTAKNPKKKNCILPEQNKGGGGIKLLPVPHFPIHPKTV